MGRIFQKAYTLVGNVEEDHRGAQRLPGADKLGVNEVPDSHHYENENLAENPAKAHIAGQLLIHNGAHHAGNVVDHNKGNQRIQKTVQPSKKPADSTT